MNESDAMLDTTDPTHSFYSFGDLDSPDGYSDEFSPTFEVDFNQMVPGVTRTDDKDSRKVMVKRPESVEDHPYLSLESKTRRHIHILSEKRRRAEMNDYFDVLKAELPASNNKKISKAALLHRAIEFIRSMKKNQLMIELEIVRLSNEQHQPTGGFSSEYAMSHSSGADGYPDWN